MTETTHEALVRQTGAAEELLDYFQGHRAALEADRIAHGVAVSDFIDDFYEEGTWRPIENNRPDFTEAVGRYIRLGKMVFVTGHVVWPVSGDGNRADISLPFAAVDTATSEYLMNVATDRTGPLIGRIRNASASYINLVDEDMNILTNSNMSTSKVWFSGLYQKA